MKEVKGSIEYVLTIDPTGEKHSLSAVNSLENDIVSLMISSQALTVQLGMWKEHKKKATGQDKVKAASNISQIAAALRGIKPLMNGLLNTYEGYKEYEAKIKSE